LDHHVERRVEDHANALRLAAAMNDLCGLSCDLEALETNIVFVDVDATTGTLTEPWAANAIREAFVAGTQPGSLFEP
ncbi:MAG: low specificity L-threonine aldolase, partial [Candidatus Neomarinimicrobiota bacterium]